MQLFVLYLVAHALCTTKTNGLQNDQNTITVPVYEITRFMFRNSLASLKTDHFNILRTVTQICVFNTVKLDTSASSP